MRNLEWQSEAWSEYIELEQINKAKLKKVNSLIKDIMRNGYDCTEGKPEMLKGNLSGYASVRIDKKNRLIFSVSDDEVTIIACGNHYSDH
ncbi:Txe/YoeB family addiction module toxin [uncultured Dialister sp.]|uniref:Txe/YoeB family addiction module toxin n=1 Tax=uncultured Dialister sp. TaxID=278064 RepID=UPI0025E2710D|nr:Txe/YoeB family addiction module toxin [uncultured Dialister sp.]